MSNDLLLEAFRGDWGRQEAISRASGVHKSVISRAVNKRRGLSPDAAERLGEVD